MRLIDADELKKAIHTYENRKLPLDTVIENAPTVERPQGKWIQYRKGHYTGVKCSECNTIMDFTTNYCPKCGAKMKE